VNDAPGSANALLPPLADGSANPNGRTIGSLLGGSIADVDLGSSLAGVAVIGNATAFAGGTWQYSTDGANWADIGTVGDDASALVLHVTTRVRFVPQPGFVGVAPSLVLRAIDDSYAGGFSTTNGGIESRTNVDASIHGGTTALGGNPSLIRTGVSTNSLPPPPPMPEPDVGGEGSESGDGSESGTGVDPGPSVAPPVADSGDERRTGRGLLEEAQDAEEERPALTLRVGAAESAPLDATSDEVRDLVVRLIEKAMPEVPIADLVFSVTQQTLIEELDALRDEIVDSLVIEQTVVGSAFAVTTGLSVGYVVWLTRGGLLLASLVSSMPAWQLMDPTPILASLAGGAKEDGESLEELLENERDETDERGEDEVREGDRP
jgi:hypothetical protein